MTRFAIAGAMAAAVVATTAYAVDPLPFTESFDNDASDWRDGSSGAPTWFATGGADGGGYISSTVTVPSEVPMFGQTVFRAQDEFGSSNGAFEGNWLGAGVTQLSFNVRHTSFAPVEVFARISGPANFPGAIIFNFGPVFATPGWQELTFDISESNPALVLAGATFEDVFSNVGHVQVGVFADDAAVNTSFDFEIDEVSIVPAPSALAVLGLGVCAVGRRRRR
ncbi:MAG: PEP-CTERM sorting domain-containing protein [Planctomycetota bacterium]